MTIESETPSRSASPSATRGVAQPGAGWRRADRR